MIRRSDEGKGRELADAAAPKPVGTLCVHCGLPVPPGMINPESEQQFCCRGCEAVYAVISGCGLDRYYRLRREAEAAAQPARTTARKYQEYDEDAFRDLYCRSAADGLQTVELYLEGVHCAACVWLVEKLPHVLPGVIEARLDLRRALVWVRWDAAQVRLSQIARTLDSLGYPPHPAQDARTRDVRRQEEHRFLIRMGVAAACAGNVMTLAFALYGGAFSGIEAEYSRLFRWASMVFGMIALVWPGSLFFRGAWAAVRTRTAHLDLPIALALAAGGVAGSINALLDRGEIYFDSLTMLVFLLLVGRWLQRRQQHRANDALELLFSLTPTSARRVDGERIEDVPIEAVRSGDVVEVLAGDSIPVDGVVLTGDSAVDRSLLTGESVAQAVAPGCDVHAGTINLFGPLRIRTAVVGMETRVGQLMCLVEQYGRVRAPITQFADRQAGRFTAAVVILAACTFGYWLWRDAALAVDHAVAVLIVACPCALGLATPLALTVALGRAAQRRILIKGGDVLESLAGRGVMFLDKTGTLTQGRMEVVSWAGDPALREPVAALERHSAHPMAVALAAGHGGVNSAETHGELTCTDVEQTPGGGIRGRLGTRRLLVGSAVFAASQGVRLDAHFEDRVRELVVSGATPVIVSIDGRCMAVAGLADPVREDVPAALAELQRLGWQVRLLSGDHAGVVAAVAGRLGIAPENAFGDVTPEDKTHYVRQAATGGPVVMVGDGVNDAVALAAATVGIAVHGGAEASLRAAHVYLGRPGLTPVVELIRAARRTLRAIYLCFLVSLCYNAGAAALAAAGVIGPLAAAILMPISSFTVLGLTFSVRTFGDAP